MLFIICYLKALQKICVIISVILDLNCKLISLGDKLPLASSTIEVDSLVSALSTEGGGRDSASTFFKNSSPNIF